MTKQSLAEVSVVVFKTVAAPSVGKIKLTLTNRRLTRAAWRVTERVISCHSAGRESVSFDSKGTVLLAPSQPLRWEWSDSSVDMRHNSSAFCHRRDFPVWLQTWLIDRNRRMIKNKQVERHRMPKHFSEVTASVWSVSDASVLNGEHCERRSAWSAFAPRPECSATLSLKNALKVKLFWMRKYGRRGRTFHKFLI